LAILTRKYLEDKTPTPLWRGYSTGNFPPLMGDSMQVLCQIRKKFFGMIFAVEKKSKKFQEST
jgi:hypothetical protein